MCRDLLTLIAAPLIVGIAIQLFVYWLGKQDGD